jgi:hypothetical protein
MQQVETRVQRSAEPLQIPCRWRHCTHQDGAEKSCPESPEVSARGYSRRNRTGVSVSDPLMTSVYSLILVTSCLDRRSFPYFANEGERAVENPGTISSANGVEG